MSDMQKTPVLIFVTVVLMYVSECLTIIVDTPAVESARWIDINLFGIGGSTSVIDYGKVFWTIVEYYKEACLKLIEVTFLYLRWPAQSLGLIYKVFIKLLGSKRAENRPIKI